MNSRARRTMIGLGAALLVGGWGTTRYADEQQQTLPVGQDTRFTLWAYGWSTIPTKRIYMIGVIGMALGAALIGFAALRTDEESR